MGKTRIEKPTFGTLRPKLIESAGGVAGSSAKTATIRADSDACENYETFSKSGKGSTRSVSRERASPYPSYISLTKSTTLAQDTNHSEQRNRLFSEDWLARNGHTFTFTGVFLFTLVLYFRPYELVPVLAGFHSMALIVAAATLLIYLPTQLKVEGNFTALSMEVKCVLFIAAWALITIPLAKNPSLAWATFTDTFIKVALIFVVMANTLRTERRIKALMWLGVGVGMMLSWQAIALYEKGEFKTDGYRVSVDFGGMFGNPNDMSIHLVMFVPIAIALVASSKSWIGKVIFLAGASIMTVGSLVTQSRGAFLGLLAAAVILVWKLGRKARFKSMLVAASVGAVLLILAPGNYGLRILSIFIPSLDPVGSSGQRSELLIRSVIVSLRNPLGIGIGNFEMVGVFNLGTHNAYTQISAELGLLAFAAYLIFLIWPLRKLDFMEKQLFIAGDRSWNYYVSIGIQASIAAYMVSSFFSSVAYQWYVYYPIAYAIGLRRLYHLGMTTESERLVPKPFTRYQEVQHV